MVRESDDKKLRRLVAAAKDFGATETKIVGTEDIIVDKRVRLKCAIPICADYGRHLLCPPNVMSVDEFSGIVRLYRKAIILQIEADVDSSDKSRRHLGQRCMQEYREVHECRQMGKEIAQVGEPDGDLCFQARLLFGCGPDWRELPPLSRVRRSSKRRVVQTSIRGEAVDGGNGNRCCQDLQEGRAATQPLVEEESQVDGIGAVGLDVQ